MTVSSNSFRGSFPRPLRWAGLLTACLWFATGCATTTGAKEQASAKIHYDIGVTSLNNNDLRGALRDLLVAVEKDPQLAEAHNALGLVYHAMKRTGESVEHYRKAVEINPGFSQAHNNLGTVLIEVGRYDEAIASFKAALNDILYGTPSLAEGNMGWAYYKKGELEKGISHLRNATATSPKFCRGYEWLARIGLDEDNGDLVVDSVRRFRKYCMDDAQIARSIPHEYRREMTYYLALGLLKLGDRERARDELASCAVGDTDIGFSAKCANSLRGLE